MIKKLRKAFTIIELVIVIAVIAVLAAVLIPTFSSLVDKANVSVDMQLVKQMNTILEAEEISNDKPSTVIVAKKILEDNGINQFKPIDNNNVFYWTGYENRVILWEWKNDEKTTGMVTYPEEYKKMYDNVSQPSNAWSNLADNYEVTIVNPVNLTNLKNAVKNAEDGAILQLPENTIYKSRNLLNFICQSMDNSTTGRGKNITIDLNGSELTSQSYGAEILASGSLTLINGSIVSTAKNVSSLFCVKDAAHLILRGIELRINENVDAIFPDGNASEVILENSKVITKGNYALATNNISSNNIYIKVANTTLQSEKCALLVNVPCDLLVKNSTIIGNGWGLIVRAGYAKVENSTIKTNNGDPGEDNSRNNTSCEYFTYNNSTSDIPYWGQGSQVPYAPLIVGDYSSGTSYNQDTTCILTNVTFENANPNKIPDIIVAARPTGKDVVLNYDNITTVSRLVVYGEGYVRTEVDGTTINHTFKHNGTIIVNGTDYTDKVGNN